MTGEAAGLLRLAVRAAHLGGAELARRRGRVTGVSYKSSATDPVTDADRAAEAAVVALLSRERPQDALLGEEGTRREGSSGLRWVLDPLDGTVNYTYGIPHSAVSIACERDEGGRWRALVGVVYDPAREETFAAARGAGATLDGEPLHVNDPVAPPTALVATGFSYAAASRARQADLVAGLLPRVRDIRSGGSAALDLCWLAAGRCDAYLEDELRPWDWAAGALIAAEAGASVTAFGDGILAAGPALHRELSALLGAPPPGTAAGAPPASCC